MYEYEMKTHIKTSPKLGLSSELRALKFHLVVIVGMGVGLRVVFGVDINIIESRLVLGGGGGWVVLEGIWIGTVIIES